ncbi:hypothetical protein KM043_007897 [Ampulex compressa]|nr:hypothetical protein KM043_007897 [Ampulex compressa]
MGEFEVIVQMIPFFLFPVVCGIKYYTCWIKNTDMKKALDIIKADWNTLQSEKEIEILKTYAAEGWFYGKIYAGQWPYDKGNLKYLPRFVISVLIVTFVLAEVFKIITTMDQFEVIVQMIPFFLFPIVSGIKYYTCWIKSTDIKKALDITQTDWNTLQSEEEIKILKTYAAEGRFYGKIYALYIFSITGGFVTLLFVPFIMDAVIPVNASRAEMLPFEAEYFIDMEGRYYFVIFHVQTVAVAGVAGIAAADIFYIAAIFHVCGLYSIARLEHLFDYAPNISSARKVAVVRMKIRRAVEFHTKCTEHVKLGLSIYTISFLLQLFVIVLIIAGLLFNVFKIVTTMGQFEVIVQMIPFFLFPVVCGIKYYTCWIKNTDMKKALDIIKADWNALQSEKEIEILKTYAAEGWFYGKIYAGEFAINEFSYRLEHLFDCAPDISTARKVAIVRTKIRRAVEFHLKCIEYVKLGLSIYTVSFVLQLFVIVLVIAGLLFNVYLLLMSDQHLLAFAFMLDLMGHYFLLVLNVIPGQRIIESSSELYHST